MNDDDGALHGKLSRGQLALLSTLVALMPLSFAISWRVKLIPVAVLLLAGVGLLVANPATRRSFIHARTVIAACALALLYPLLNALGHRLGWGVLDRPSHVLLYIATAAAFSVPLRMRWVWSGFSLTAAGLGVVCIVQHDVLSIGRAYGLNGGAWGAIEFAMLLLVLSLMSLTQVLYGGGSPWQRGLHVAGAVLGMYGALLTQSRGPLLAFVPVFLLLALNYARHTGHWRRFALALVVVICGGVLAAMSVHGVMLDRFADVGAEVASYDHRNDASGAVRERIEMWRTAGHAIADHPLAGVGIDQFGSYVRQQVAAGHANAVIAKYDHPHSEYLEAAAAGGVPGLLVLLAVFALPATYFARYARHRDPTIMLPALAGLTTVGMYVLCAFSDNVFYRAMPHSLYFFLVLGLAVHVGSLTPPSRPLRGV